MNIFPFTMHNAHNTKWFRSWVQENKRTLDEEYGRYVFSGNKEYDSKKHFSYYEADVTFLSPSQMLIDFYRMACTVYEGRGELICAVPAVPDVKAIQQLIEQRILELTAEEYDRREIEHLKKQREDGITVLRQELFGKLKY